MKARSITVGPTRVEVVLALDPGEPRSTSDAPGLIERVTGALPGLARHSCTSPESGLFASEMRDTEIAHLFEHVALEIMVLAGSPRTIAGHTEWDVGVDGPGVYRVWLDYDDDAVAVGAVRTALEVLDSGLRDTPMPDIGTAAARFASLRSKA